MKLSRRTFLKAAAAAAPLVLPASALGRDGTVAPSERIAIGCIGTGNQGVQDMRAALQYDDAQVVAICDVNTASYGYKTADQYLGREPARQIVDEFYAEKKRSGRYRGCGAHRDFREVMQRDDIDAVIIVVPDQWHAPMTVMAARLGKDIYCEKPLSLTVADGQAMVREVRRCGVVLQTGSHERSRAQSRFACELVRNGRIGEVRRVVTIVGPNNKTAPPADWTPTPIPQGFDYDMWLGPAPWVPHHKDRCFYTFRFGLDYSGGQTTNYGAHSNDLAQWGLGMDHTGPVEFEDMGSEWPRDGLFTTATKIHFRAWYKNGVELVCQTGPENVQVRFEGTEGWVQTGYRGFTTEPASLKTSVIGPHEIQLYRSENHMRDFLDCIKTRGEPAAPVELGHRTANLCHVGNIAMRLKRKLKWDPEKEHFENDEGANRMLGRPLRAPWHL